ncbi:PAS domain S-box protein [Bdellovibrio sp. NC01]|uniref:PAS domain S-box protein n=1 Tax=Bdellovibrio sp. NC01 TaxID=2220073 RepID=UPI0011586FD9|nr:PAS domain S-box protein [Bdellovibrio sp. NC01]QDK37764.1 hypothetical protein DOE51_09300 [Bdellovibrio sp. NC01]
MKVNVSTLFKDILTNKNYAIYLADKNGQVGLWNSLAEKLFGFLAQEIVALNEKIIFHAFDEKVSCGGYRFRWRMRKDGSAFFAKETVIEVTDSPSPRYRFLKIVENLSEHLTAFEKSELMSAQYKNTDRGGSAIMDLNQKILVAASRLPDSINLKMNEFVGSKAENLAVDGPTVMAKLIKTTQNMNRSQTIVTIEGRDKLRSTWLSDVRLLTDNKGDAIFCSYSWNLSAIAENTSRHLYS